MELVRRGLAPSRDVARAAIASGEVTVAGAPALKPTRLVAPDQPLAVGADPRRYASWGGDKLEAALDRFQLTVQGRVALDAGASTGGFTDCLLQYGASQVIAVDVGRGQLHERLRRDPSVHVLDRTNIRELTPDQLPSGLRPDLVVADLSFISLRTVAPSLVALATAGGRGDLVVLVKPQFEAGRADAAKGKGVITDPAIWRAAIKDVADTFASNRAELVDVMASPRRGAEGNVEFLAHLRTGTDSAYVLSAEQRDQLISAAIDTAPAARGGE